MSESVKLPELPSTEPLSELPAVQPPTVGFIVQLFLIPALIVAVSVLVWLLFGKIAASHRTPEEYLADLRQPNYERRWSAARDLAAILPHNREWQNDESFAMELAKELEDELQKAKSGPVELPYLKYVAEVLGEFNSTAVLPALRQAIQPGVNNEVRQKAVVGFGRLVDRVGGLSDPDALSDLIEAGKDDDVAIRGLVAWVLGRTGNIAAMDGLKPMLHDSDLDVRLNAASSLARLGSLASLETLQEMTDLSQLRDKLQLRGLTDQQVQPQLEIIPISAVQSLVLLLDKSPSADIEHLRPNIESLAKSGTPIVQTRAKELLIKMGKAK